jgi:hypothetical protein
MTNDQNTRSSLFLAAAFAAGLLVSPAASPATPDAVEVKPRPGERVGHPHHVGLWLKMVFRHRLAVLLRPLSASQAEAAWRAFVAELAE